MSSAAKGALVCVTGAAGYIASHIVKQLLERGYKVRGTVRDAKSAKNAFLRALPGASERLELFEADLLRPGSFDTAVKGCTFVMHTASPYFVTVKDPQKDLVDPALQGTLNVLQACLTHQATIEKVVITSSCAAVTDSPDGKIYNENDWNVASSLTRNPYFFSKAVAERAAHDFVAKNKPKFKLATINPSLVFGPSLNDLIGESVESVVVSLFNGTFPMVVDLAWSCVDVRDVARAHVLACETASAEGRFICASDTLHLRDLFAIVKKNYPKAAVPSLDFSGSVGNFLTYCTAYFYEKGKRDFVQTNIGRAAHYDTSKIKNGLGIQFMKSEDSILDTIKDLIAKKKITIPQ